MGAYLSEPIRDKDSCDETCESLTYGASCMQGWRVSQEDAHNCCPNFDKESDTSLFAVYDGHGGAEVAQYTAIHFPDFVKKLEEYKEGKLAAALEKGFLSFDDLLTEEKVIKELKELAGVNPDEDEATGDGKGEEEAATLCEEATMPLEQLLERYGYAPGSKKTPGNLLKEGNFQSPAIRAKKGETEAAKADSNEASSKSTDDGVAMKLESQLLNGHSENENNANLEKERADKLSKESAQETVVDSTTKDNGIQSNKTAESAHSNAFAEAEARDLSGDKKSSGTNGSPTAEEKPSSSTQEVAGVGSSSSTNSSSEAEGSASEGPSSSSHVGAGASSSKMDDAGPGPSSSKSDDCKPGSSSGRVIEDDSEEDSEEEEWNSSDEDEMEGMPGSDDEDDEGDEEGDEEEEDEIMTGGEEPGSDSGCTAVVALLRGRDLYVANAGDSRCVVSREGKAVDMSVDHKPEDDLERNRIEKAGGKVTADGRVNGGLNLSRAIGDHCYKKNKEMSDKEQMITALPDVRCITLDEKDEFMVLACDGIWNAMTSQDVVDFVSQRMSHGVEKLSTICEEMFEFCLAPDTTGDGTGCDNMTGIIVKFDKALTSGNIGSAPKRSAEEISKDSSEDTSVPDTKKAKGDNADSAKDGENKTDSEANTES